MKLTDINVVFELWSWVSEFEVSDDVILFWTKDILKNCLDNKEPIFVAKDWERIVWFIIANYNKSLKKGIIENIFVVDEYRWKWVWNKLLSILVAYLKNVWCEYLCTILEKGWEDAINFYIRNGFGRGIECLWLDKVLGNNFLK